VTACDRVHEFLVRSPTIHRIRYPQAIRPNADHEGAPGVIRTPDSWFRKPLLYPLSYGGLVGSVPTCTSASRAGSGRLHGLASIFAWSTAPGRAGLVNASRSC
jgi:hypothetical protein